MEHDQSYEEYQSERYAAEDEGRANLQAEGEAEQGIMASEPHIMRLCPFCGGEPNGRCVEFVNKKFFQISCKNEKCLMQPETAMIDDENKVLEIWNARA